MEVGPKFGSLDKALETEIDTLSRATQETIKKLWELDLNQFEYMRLRIIARSYLLNKYEQGNVDGDAKKDSLELAERFLLSEYGFTSHDLPKHELSDVAISPDSIQYLKILQSRNRDGSRDETLI